MRYISFNLILLSTMILSGTAPPCSIGALNSDREAVERVYYSHRTGTKKTFQELMPPEILARLVEQDLLKERVLAGNYGIRITEQQVQAESERIQASTRAPDILAEIKSVLGDDEERFGRTVVRPILVDQNLRRCFENDESLHAEQRERVDRIRNSLSADGGPATQQQVATLRAAGQWQEVVWRFKPATGVPGTKAAGGPYAVLASASMTELAPEPSGRMDLQQESVNFEDLHPDLQRVLGSQLLRPGDVSALIERPREFQLFVCRERTVEKLKVAILTIPKRNFEDWLKEQEG